MHDILYHRHRLDSVSDPTPSSSSKACLNSTKFSHLCFIFVSTIIWSSLVLCLELLLVTNDCWKDVVILFLWNSINFI